jgi:phthalate 4,5-dioxygenase oxygenase subunit
VRLLGEDLVAWRNTDGKVSIVKMKIDCNWAQVLEGAIDSAHSPTLHSSDITPSRVVGTQSKGNSFLRPSTDKAPRIQVQPAGYGFKYAALRRPISNADSQDCLRTTAHPTRRSTARSSARRSVST